ncbi:glycosyltransferase [Salisediminibacterium beveridgei]|uniref:Group 1 Glycosyl Transferase n=1 Tax=Salisediminibacterium beveridgei TaxID=632773 RepID=A0A1D7QRM2_9BACI|nr:glycosyltransferase [Salisediminibacterium beveridgei]AOM81655.1 Group 1 Glycosyl Transferase [Salisediminibacterium beveridgei]
MKVAILQNQLNIGGRSKVTAEVIRIFNDQGIVPDVFTFSDDKAIQQFKNHYRKCDFELFTKLPKIKFVRGYIYQVVLMNLFSLKYLKEYDMIYNCNDSMYFLPKDIYKLHYINFPLEENFKYTNRYKNPIWHLYFLPLKFLFLFKKRNFQNGSILCNSEFTKKKLVDCYGDLCENPKVLYPPTIDGVNSIVDKKDQVVSVGAITPDKEQLAQIKIAEKMPDICFFIIGAIKSNAYYRECNDYIARNNIKNVNIVHNADDMTLKQYLSESKFFLHTKVNEHFGISTVESLGYQCIPIVSNSGGQKEIVKYDELRFNTIDEAVNKLKIAIDSKIKFGKDPYTFDYIKRFYTSNFEREILKKIEKGREPDETNSNL